MRIVRETTKYQGVYQRRFENKRDPRDGKADICYDITYKIGRQKVWEKIGWKSEGMSAQAAREIRVDRMKAVISGEPLPRDAAAQPEPADPAQILTFADAWKIYDEKWLPNLVRPINDRGRYTHHIEPRFADVPLQDIKPLDLETFKQELLAKGLSPKTSHHVLCLIRSVYNKLIEWELYEGLNPISRIKMPKVDNARIRYLTTEEADRLLKDLKNRSLTWWRIASISLNAGLRLGEVLDLTWGDLDMEAGVIHVLDSKTGTRMAHMNTVLKCLFDDMEAGSASSLIFQSRNGEPLSGLTIGKTFARSVARLKLNEHINDRRNKVVFHSLRHTFASWLAIEGVPLYTISELMGHSTLEMTKRYAHLCPDSKRDAVAKLVGRINRES